MAGPVDGTSFHGCEDADKLKEEGCFGKPDCGDVENF